MHGGPLWTRPGREGCAHRQDASAALQPHSGRGGGGDRHGNCHIKTCQDDTLSGTPQTVSVPLTACPQMLVPAHSRGTRNLPFVAERPHEY